MTFSRCPAGVLPASEVALMISGRMAVAAGPCTTKAGSATGVTKEFAEYEAKLIIHQATGNWRGLINIRQAQLSSRHLLPGSIAKHALECAELWIPVTSTGMTVGLV